MNNKFLCRGKRKDTGKWVEGYYVEMPVGEKEPLYLIIGLDGQYNRVIPETVGQIESDIEDTPAADVAPVIHGHWIFGEFNGIGTPVWCRTV